MSDSFIKEQRDFNRIIKSGQQINTPIGRMKFLKNAVNTPKLGVVLGKTQGLTAVKRNRIRRIIKEAWRKVFPKLLMPVEIVVFPLNRISGLKSSEIEIILRNQIENGLGNKNTGKQIGR